MAKLRNFIFAALCAVGLVFVLGSALELHCGKHLYTRFALRQTHDTTTSELSRQETSPAKTPNAISRQVVFYLAAEGCSVNGAAFSTKGEQLILTIHYSLTSKQLWPQLYTLHCGVVGVDSAYRYYRQGSVTHRTFVGGLSNEVGGIDIKWPRAYKLNEEIQYTYMCS